MIDTARDLRQKLETDLKAGVDTKMKVATGGPVQSKPGQG